ncbi:PRD domain-containing protein [Caldalkalibacillus salinus]|uniref:PRD domain-containing protein n=1 Tax=Caldalkalibacillus salinus TaxID=2803787 RepID=UPI0019221FC8|nr:PRD domain-containing protein [Caldalkalibacillus salinus]
METNRHVYKIKKVLNNNAVVAHDDECEKIVMGAGIGFNKKKNDIIPRHQIEKVFVMEEGNERFLELLRTIPEEHIMIAEEIISYAEQKLEAKLNQRVHIALTDHLSFAFERMKQNIQIENKLLNEIKVLYRKEYEVGLWAQSLIKEKIGIDIPDDEAGYIAMHINTAKMSTHSMSKTLQQTTLINELINMVGENIGLKIDKESIGYQRLITHLQFALVRIEDGESLDTMDPEILTLIKKKYERAFQCAQKMAEHAKQYGIHFPESEMGYISLHIQRLH